MKIWQVENVIVQPESQLQLVESLLVEKLRLVQIMQKLLVELQQSKLLVEQEIVTN